ncbi:hypothetical protein ACMC5U_07270 [Deferribacteres bacterium DY0609]|uniref:hypothetical protein n=1 Tax=Denitrovibrio acetiphilus TaxID=118000 RepID=UPI00019B3D1F|nr:hypothetical protein [Denitrovibrio acetiphilus]
MPNYIFKDKDYEIKYVASLYPTKKDKVAVFLKEKCKSGEISYSTHMEVYNLIKKELGLPLPY